MIRKEIEEAKKKAYEDEMNRLRDLQRQSEIEQLNALRKEKEEMELKQR